MATITITVPDGTQGRIVNALAEIYHYDTQKKTGETKAAFAERAQKNQWKRQVLEVEALAAEKAAGDAVRADAADPFVTDPD